MSSETDHPRQRTVAELLAAHGDGTATGRRARRRAAENATGGGTGAASGGYPAVGANGAGSAQPQGGPPYGGPAAGGGADPGPIGGGAPFGNGPPDAVAGPPLNSGSFPTVGQQSPPSGSFPATGGPPASPPSTPFPAVGGPPSQLNSGSFPAVAPNGGPAPLSSGPIPTVGGPPNSGSFPAVNGTRAAPQAGTNGAGRPEPPNGAPGGPTSWGDAAPAAGNGAPAGPTAWGAGGRPPANGAGPTAWGEGPPAGNGAAAWGAHPPGGPATWGPDTESPPGGPGNGAGRGAWGAAADSAVQPGGGARPPTWGRGPRPTAGGGPAAWGPGHSGAPSGGDLPQTSWGPGDGPAEGAAPRRGNPVTPWGPDTETDPNFRGRSRGAGGRGGPADEAADDAADPSSHNGGADGTRKRRPSPRRGANLPDFTARNDPDSDAAFVNGGAVYDDPYRPRPESTDDASGAEVTHRIGGHVPSPEGRDRPRTGQVRRRADRTTMLDPGMTGPIAPQLPADDGGPSTAVGLAPAGAETWHRDRTGRRGGWDGGPPTEASAPFRLDDDEADGPDGPDGYRDYDDEYDNNQYDNNRNNGHGDRRVDADRVGYLDRPNDDPDDHPAGLAAAPQRRARSGAPSAGQAWAAVVAQWIAGAIGGAALWVGFRFLWRDLPVVALAAAVLVTVGLVLVVRALMHNDDRRTTLFAVLVGLLLTVSPAILVLLGR